MKLRHWQKSCVRKAIDNFERGSRKFFCSATPGAGKTIAAAHIAKILLETQKVDFILCVSPSVNVQSSMRNTLELVIGRPIDGLFGASGICVTYQALSLLSEDFWKRLNRLNVFMIVDEIHHCKGNNASEANSWSKSLVEMSGNQNTYTLSLSGTPWRTDKAEVTTCNYQALGTPEINFTYSLLEAIQDGVCRKPVVYLIDNDQWRITSNSSFNTTHSNLSSLLENEPINYQQVLDNSEFLKHTLKLSNRELSSIRDRTADAGGLVVASTIEHAKKICGILLSITGEYPTLITSLEFDSQQKLKLYSRGQTRWLVSVGMVSEGTDIPRLHLCCHLSRIRTELHFRQVLGRILRLRVNDMDPTSKLIMPAQPELKMYATRLAEELPAIAIIKTISKSESIAIKNANTVAGERQRFNGNGGIQESFIVDKVQITPQLETKQIDSFIFKPSGRFRKEVMQLL